jgi:uncharacterized protein YuzE
MKLNYYEQTDSLYIDLSNKQSARSKEISEGVILDYDSNDDLVGIDIDNASKKLNIEQFTINRLPFKEDAMSS